MKYNKCQIKTNKRETSNSRSSWVCNNGEFVSFKGLKICNSVMHFQNIILLSYSVQIAISLLLYSVSFCHQILCHKLFLLAIMSISKCIYVYVWFVFVCIFFVYMYVLCACMYTCLYNTSIFTRLTPGKLKEFCRSHADLSYSFWVWCSEPYSELRPSPVFSERSN